jgi:hypothetical protein
LVFPELASESGECEHRFLLFPNEFRAFRSLASQGQQTAQRVPSSSVLPRALGELPELPRVGFVWDLLRHGLDV